MGQVRIELQLPPQEAFERVKAAMVKTGWLEDANPTTRSLQGQIPAGLSKLPIRVSVLTTGDDSASLLEIQGNASNFDPYGVERRALDKLVNEIA